MRSIVRRTLATLCLAAPCLVAAAGPAAASSLVVGIDQTTRLNIPGAAASVLVGNSAIADVTVIDSHTLYVLGRGYGATDIVVLDRDGRALYTADLVVSSADSGRVSVYRGPARTDMACAPGCQVTIRSTGGGSAPAPSGGGGASPLSAALGALTGASSPAAAPVAPVAPVP
ncbi:MAG TPA: pilus assembly protein N-terminal domain-containing protein [Caulobacteraceae bacterium]|jgi:Flp pilus assembly secretin CpaC|nr:pilus assembly protein N-terminal domain-containing protein [Caulobacteraceae bacterium]